MVHGEYRIRILEVFLLEQGIGRQGADQIYPFLAQTGQGGFDHVDLFTAEMAPFPGMGVEAADVNSGVCYAELALEIRIQDADHLGKALLGDGHGNVGQRNVGGRQRHPQPFGGQQHHHVCGV
ncbi:hypothetical protein D3C72_1727490 [compost metagenome]